jgi:hypothetical protein
LYNGTARVGGLIALAPGCLGSFCNFAIAGLGKAHFL